MSLDHNRKKITRQQQNSATFAVAVESIVDVTVEGTGWSEYDFMASLNLYSTHTQKDILWLTCKKQIFS